MTREITNKNIIEAVTNLCLEANIDLPQDVTAALEKAYETEESELGREILERMLENARIARSKRIPICQDTGLTVLFLELGQEVTITGGDLSEALNEGVRRAYTEGYFRKSVLADPLFDRTDTGDNTPAAVHAEVVPGSNLKISVLIKGGGSERVGKAQVLKPADGINGVKKFVLEAVEEAGPNACPPMVVGVGCGGTLDHAAYIAKKALLRPIGPPNDDAVKARLESEILEAINKLGFGPAGLGGRVTALAVHLETYPVHISALPVAVDLSCYALRRKSVTL